jgi:hypothetical protein
MYLKTPLEIIMTNTNANTVANTVATTVSEEARMFAECTVATIDPSMSIALLKLEHHFWAGLLEVVPFDENNFWPGTWANWVEKKDLGVLMEEPQIFTKEELVSYLEANFNTWLKENWFLGVCNVGDPPGTIPEGLHGHCSQCGEEWNSSFCNYYCN